jgi:hypothetical protein
MVKCTKEEVDSAHQANGSAEDVRSWSNRQSDRRNCWRPSQRRNQFLHAPYRAKTNQGENDQTSDRESAGTPWEMENCEGSGRPVAK